MRYPQNKRITHKAWVENEENSADQDKSIPAAMV
jgi:hypothetical protein